VAGFEITPEEVVDGVNERYGRHPGYRTLHAKGRFYKATFTATPYASKLTRAAHMQGEPVEALVRLSNGSGRPDNKDYVPDVRGLAVSFKLPDGSSTDVLAQTAPNFPINTPEGFVEVVQANVAGLARLIKFPVFLAKHPDAFAGLPANLRALAPPRSYVSRRYFAIHAFKWVNADGAERFVKYTWVPQGEEESISPKEAKELGPDYLQEEMVERLKRGPARFTFEVQIAQPGDDTEDPRKNWPDDRERVAAGTLEITELAPDPEQDGNLVVFDPMRLTDGIEPSDDPILRIRSHAYSVSVERRAGVARPA
jgi:catalase